MLQWIGARIKEFLLPDLDNSDNVYFKRQTKFKRNDATLSDDGDKFVASARQSQNLYGDGEGISVDSEDHDASQCEKNVSSNEGIQSTFPADGLRRKFLVRQAIFENQIFSARQNAMASAEVRETLADGFNLGQAGRKGRISMQTEYLRSNFQRMKAEREMLRKRSAKEAELRRSVHLDFLHRNAKIGKCEDAAFDVNKVSLNEIAGTKLVARSIEEKGFTKTCRSSFGEGETNSEEMQFPHKSAFGSIVEHSKYNLKDETKGHFTGPDGNTITKAESHLVAFAWSDTEDQDEVLADNGTFRLRRREMMCLCDGNLLNDELINFKLDMLQTEALKRFRLSATYGEKRPLKVLVWSTHFYVRLVEISEGTRGYNYENVRRWTTRKMINVFALDRVIVPIHEGSHWSCAVVDVKNKRFEHYDSLGNRNSKCLEYLSKWLEDEARDKLNVELDICDWKFVYPKDIPQQTNAQDCGVFALLFAESVGCGSAIHFTSDHVGYFRRRFVVDIMTGGRNVCGP